MFTGIITAVGQIVHLEPLKAQVSAGLGVQASASTSPQTESAPSAFGLRLTVEATPDYLADVALGDSIALNGACMTVTQVQDKHFYVDISQESLSKTTGLSALGPVNLEKALRANDRLGGHIVSGHVDGIAQVRSFRAVGESWELCVHIPGEFAKFLAYKGSVVINGVSLTVNRVSDDQHPGSGCEILINLIPHTLEHTTLKYLRDNALVNLEIDTVARYVERMMQFGK